MVVALAVVFASCHSAEFKEVKKAFEEAEQQFDEAQDCESLGKAFFESVQSLSEAYQKMETLDEKEKAEAEELFQNLENKLKEREDVLCKDYNPGADAVEEVMDEVEDSLEVAEKSLDSIAK